MARWTGTFRRLRISRLQLPATGALRMIQLAIVNVFIVSYIVAVFFWSLPFDGGLKSSVNRRTAPYVLFTGLWQSWDMFSPDPKNIQVKMDATVTMRDGTSRKWVFF